MADECAFDRAEATQDPNDEWKIIVPFRGTGAELMQLKLQAAVAGLSVNDWVRQQCGLPVSYDRTIATVAAEKERMQLLRRRWPGSEWPTR